MGLPKVCAEGGFYLSAVRDTEDQTMIQNLKGDFKYELPCMRCGNAQYHKNIKFLLQNAM